MRDHLLIHSFTVGLALCATLLTPDADARAASSVPHPRTVEVPSIGSMRRIIIPADGVAVPEVKPNTKTRRPAKSQAPVRSNLGSAVQAPVQSMINRAVRAGARGAVNPLPLQ